RGTSEGNQCLGEPADWRSSAWRDQVHLRRREAIQSEFTAASFRAFGTGNSGKSSSGLVWLRLAGERECDCQSHSKGRGEFTSILMNFFDPFLLRKRPPALETRVGCSISAAGMRARLDQSRRLNRKGNMARHTIRELRAYVFRGGGGDYHDQTAGHWIDDHIATPMAKYPEYRMSRQSFGLNVLGTLVVEVEADNGVTGFAV